MPKAALAKIMGIAEEPCLMTGKKEFVAEVQVGKYTYPLYIGDTPLWEKIGGKRDQPANNKGGSKGSEDIEVETVRNGQRRAARNSTHSANGKNDTVPAG